MARRYGPREWTPRPPTPGDFNDAIDEWSEVEGYLEGLEQINTIRHVLYKTREWLQGHTKKPDKNDLLDLNTAISGLGRSLDRINAMIQQQALPPTVELAKWLKRAIKEGESS